jgi:hypothetical protein
MIAGILVARGECSETHWTHAAGKKVKPHPPYSFLTVTLSGPEWYKYLVSSQASNDAKKTLASVIVNQ